ncbi:MAG TPA: hypothetical protein VMB72_09300 [Acidimicrobiales bacterium]|nr:hypothetical protein [Acidimicrobiales bacterium]
MQASMVAAATEAIKSRQTSSAQTGYDGWIHNAIASESGQGFQVTGAGVVLLAFHVDSESSFAAAVSVRAFDWQNQVILQTNGSLATNDLRQEEVDEIGLASASSGQWLVNAVTTNFVPGEGP